MKGKNLLYMATELQQHAIQNQNLIQPFQIVKFFWKTLQDCKKLYFVTKIVLTYCEKKLF